MNKQIRTSRRRFLSASGTAVAAAALACTTTTSGQNASISAVVTRRSTLADVDVLIVGGGPAGIGAAIATARQGIKTLLVENHSFFGGVGAWSMGMQMNQMRPGGKPRSLVHELLIDKLKAYGDAAVRLGQHEVWAHVEYLKVAIMDALDAAGCRYLVHVRAAEAVVESNRVTGVIVATKAGLQTIRARIVVDCTGDADVASYAGAETLVEAGTLMPMTLGLTLTNIDPSQIRTADVEKAIRAGRAKHPLITSGFLEIKPVANSKTSLWINHAGTADLGRVDPTDAEARSKAECFGRRQALQMVQSVRESDNPALRAIEWGSAGPQLSVRESRRVKGLYVITEEDAMTGRTFEDTIAWRSGFLDLGGQKGGKYVKMQIHDVPYRALVPVKLDSLLTAGRCISATHAGAAAGKSMGNCMATGHAAGLAAALCVKRNCQPRELKVADLQAALRGDGVDLAAKDRTQESLK